MVQVRNESLIDTPKYSLYSQNPVSLTWDNTIEPAPILKANKLGLTPVLIKIGRIKPAVVIPATVEDPVTIRNKAAINHAMINGLRLLWLVIFKISSPTCIACKISLKAPAPANVSMRGATSLMASINQTCISDHAIPLLKPNK